MNWYLKVLKNYATFSGRARRKEYWMFALFNIIFSLVVVLLDNVFGTAIEELGYGLFFILYNFAVIIPSMAVLVRRLHDIGKSGSMFFVALIPLVGPIWLLALLTRDSDPGENGYGLNPKEHPDADGRSAEPVSSTRDDNPTGDTIILLVVIWLFIELVFRGILPGVVDDWFRKNWVFQVNRIMQFIWGFVPLGLAFSVKNKSKRVVAFVIGGIYLLHRIYIIMSPLVLR